MVWRLLAYDDQILTPMGLVGQPLTERGKRIIKRSYYEGVAGSEKRLCVYFRPSRQIRNNIFHEQVLQVDCHVPADQDYMAYRIQKRVKELLHRYEFPGRVLFFSGMLGELPSVSGFVCVGTRFTFYAGI